MGSQGPWSGLFVIARARYLVKATCSQGPTRFSGHVAAFSRSFRTSDWDTFYWKVLWIRGCQGRVLRDVRVDGPELACLGHRSVEMG